MFTRGTWNVVCLWVVTNPNYLQQVSEFRYIGEEYGIKYPYTAGLTDRQVDSNITLTSNEANNY